MKEVAKIALLVRLEPHERPLACLLADYWALTKPDVNLLIAIAVFASFCLARLAFGRSNVIARQLLLASIIYLPTVFLLMLFDRN